MNDDVSSFPRLKDWYIANQFWEKQPFKKPRTINATMQNPRQKWVQILNLHHFQCLLNDNSFTRLEAFSITNLRKNNTNIEQAIIYKNSQDIHYTQINFVTIFLGEKIGQKKTRDMGSLSSLFVNSTIFFVCVSPNSMFWTFVISNESPWKLGI